MRTRDKVKILRRARKLIDRGWTQYTYARTRSEKRISPYSVHAKKFCVLGALLAASNEKPKNTKKKEQWLENFCACIRPKYFSKNQEDMFDFLLTWNDVPGRTKQQVLAVLDRIIRRIERDAERNQERDSISLKDFEGRC